VVSSTKKNDHYDITEILLKVALNTIIGCWICHEMWLFQQVVGKAGKNSGSTDQTVEESHHLW
jgi:hypothetical protein